VLGLIVCGIIDHCFMPSNIQETQSSSLRHESVNPFKNVSHYMMTVARGVFTLAGAALITSMIGNPSPPPANAYAPSILGTAFSQEQNDRSVPAGFFQKPASKSELANRGNETAVVVLVGDNIEWDDNWDDTLPKETIDDALRVVSTSLNTTPAEMSQRGLLSAIVPKGEPDTDFDGVVEKQYDPQDVASFAEQIVKTRDEMLTNTDIGRVLFLSITHGGIANFDESGRHWYGSGLTYEQMSAHLGTWADVKVIFYAEECFAGLQILGPYIYSIFNVGKGYSYYESPDASVEFGGHPDIVYVGAVGHNELAYQPGRNNFPRLNGMSMFARYLTQNDNGSIIDAIQKLRRDNSGRRENLPLEERGNTGSITFPFRLSVTDDGITRLSRYSVGEDISKVTQVDMDDKNIGSDSWAVAIDQLNDRSYVLRNLTSEQRTITTDTGKLIVLEPYQTVQLSQEVGSVTDNEGFEATKPEVDESARCFVVDPNAMRITDGEIAERQAFLPIANICNQAMLVTAVLPTYSYSSSSTPDSVKIESRAVYLPPNSQFYIPLAFSGGEIYNLWQLPVPNHGYPVEFATQFTQIPGTIPTEVQLAQGPSVSAKRILLQGPYSGKGLFLPYSVRLPMLAK
jgi:hypothetical protein